MLRSPQFLNVLAAEHVHLATVSITLHTGAYARFERKLGEAFKSSSYSKTSKARNEERLRVVWETLEGHPGRVVWILKWLRDETCATACQKCQTPQTREVAAPRAIVCGMIDYL